MLEYLFFLAMFALGALAAAAAASTGYRGRVCDRRVGYVVPARVESDPDLAAEANALVARWGTVVALMSAAPLVPLTQAVVDGRDPLPLRGLVVLAVYGFVLSCVGSHPFARIQHLAADPPG